ncbi:hypothetical protein KUCAC02_004239, partial [Chaenocephalus aceratus]
CQALLSPRGASASDPQPRCWRIPLEVLPLSRCFTAAAKGVVYLKGLTRELLMKRDMFAQQEC